MFYWDGSFFASSTRDVKRWRKFSTVFITYTNGWASQRFALGRLQLLFRKSLGPIYYQRVQPNRPISYRLRAEAEQRNPRVFSVNFQSTLACASCRLPYSLLDRDCRSGLRYTKGLFQPQRSRPNLIRCCFCVICMSLARSQPTSN